ncbi:MAG TPA: CPBP family intramembrane glutamic endopeptidase [Ktedonobacterales bacterium]|nr:CPBP family intramembrane glutamic endopeptidase [Ktedonobacterales bacterium]
MKMSAARLPVPLAAGIVIALLLPYTVLNTLFPGPVVTYALGLVLAALALGALWLAGVAPGACGVRVAPLSRRGAWALLALALYVPATVLAGVSQPWSWVAALVYAPASALGQELYFRGALLAAVRRLMPARQWHAVALQALAFAVWHVRAFRVVAPGLALLALGGTALAGAVWGWQARRDSTLLYAWLEHTLFLIVV